MFFHMLKMLFKEFKPSEYMPCRFFQEQIVTLVYVCLKLVNKLTKSQTFYLKLLIAIVQKGKWQVNH